MPGGSSSGLAHYVDAWEQSLRSTLDLASHFADPDWSRPTRCPGWDVHDQVAHLVSVEAQLAGAPAPPEAPPETHVRGAVGELAERGVHARRDLPGPQLLAEFQGVLAKRLIQLRARPLTSADELLGVSGKPRPAETVLRARTFDVWAHEQDIRAALELPGNLYSPASEVAREAISAGLASTVLAKAGAAAGQSLVVEFEGRRPSGIAVEMDAEGHGHVLASAPQSATTRLRLTWPDLVARACGRSGAERTPVHVEGDADLGRRVLDVLTITP